MSYGYEYDGYEGDAPYAAADPVPPQADPAAGRGRRRRAAPEPEPQPEAAYESVPYEPGQYESGPHESASYESGPYDRQWEHSGLGWEQEAWNRAQYAEYADDRYDTRFIAQPVVEPVQGQMEAPGPAEYEPGFDSALRTAPEPPLPSPPAPPTEQAPPTESAPSPTTKTSGTADGIATAGRGAFGAAGLAVVTAIGAIAATPVLAVIVGLSQIGLAIGWTRSVGLPHARRTVILVAGIGLVAAVLAYRMIPDHAPAAIGAALGVGFVFLAADQLFRKDAAAAWPRSEAFAVAVTGAGFAVLPAGYIVAQRVDSALAGACALAAAVAVLCSALVGGGARPTGILAGAVAATAVGTLTAVSLSASAGSKGGAMGGLMSGVFAVVGARTADRLGDEGSDVRISAQALPLALSAIGAVIAAQVVR